MAQALEGPSRCVNRAALTDQRLHATFIPHLGQSILMPVRVRRRLTKWGNGFGIRITVAEATRLGLQAGQDVDLEVHAATARNDLSTLPTWNLGGDYDIDEVLDDDLEEQHGGR